jgi:hypothetical protein
VVDEVRVLRLLRSISDDLAVLRAEASADPGRRADPLWLRVLSADLADHLRRAVGFRNVLVHDYIAVDDGIVLERLANLADLDDFIAVVATWVVPPCS